MDIAPPVAADVDSSDALIKQAEEAFSAGKSDETRQLLNKVLLKNPRHPNALFLSARLEADLGDIKSAIATLQDIPISDLAWGLPAAGQRAEWLASLGEVDAARKLYEEMLEVAPDVPMIRRELASLMNKVGWRYAAAEVMRPLILSGDATEDELRMSMSLSESYAAALPLAGEGQPRRVEGPLSLAINILNTGKPREAAEILERIVKQNPGDAEAVACLSRVLSETQQYDRLAALLASAPPGIERFPNVWIAQGDRYINQDEVSLGVSSYFEALRLDPLGQVAHQRLAAALLRDGRLNEAKEFDDRFFVIRAAMKAMRATGPGMPDEVRAGKDLVQDLERLGEATLGIAWLEKLMFRHQYDDNFQQWVKEKRKRLENFSIEEIASRRRLAIASEYPAPKLTVDANVSLVTSQTPKLMVDAAVTEADFVNIAADVGLIHEYLNSSPRRVRNLRIFEQLGGGAAALDYDLDGHCDFYFAQGASDLPPRQSGDQSVADRSNALGVEKIKDNALFRNLAGSFKATGSQASVEDKGYGLGVTSGDWNQDGFPDLFVGNLGKNTLYINQGDGTFREVHSDAMATRPTFTTSVAIADVNGDALPDLIEVNYVSGDRIYEPLAVGPDGFAMHYAGPLVYPAEHDHVWLTQPDGSLESFVLSNAKDQSQVASKQTSELGDSAYPGLGLVVTDLDGKPGLEIFVANDLRPNQLWRLNRSEESQSMVATDYAVISGCALSSRGQANACMGVAASDFDSNGTVDLLITNWIDEWVNYFLQTENGTFRDHAPEFGLDVLSEDLLGFGAQPVDFNLDGRMDVAIANGHIDDLRHQGEPYQMPTQLLVNLGAKFENAKQLSTDYWDEAHVGRCMITTDFNNDGDTDLVVVDMNEPVALLENRTRSGNSWIQLELVGTASERDAIGARIEVKSASHAQSQVATTGDGYQGKNQNVMTFGLGSDNLPVNIIVRWPSGQVSNFINVALGKRYLIVEGESLIGQR